MHIHVVVIINISTIKEIEVFKHSVFSCIKA